MVLARTALEHLTEGQIELALDTLAGHDVHLNDTDLAAMLEFVRIAQAEFRDVPAATEIKALTQQRHH